jgi:hypothetical protein
LRIAARKKPAEKPTRRSPGDGACYQRTGTKTDPATGESVPYVSCSAHLGTPLTSGFVTRTSPVARAARLKTCSPRQVLSP